MGMRCSSSVSLLSLLGSERCLGLVFTLSLYWYSYGTQLFRGHDTSTAPIINTNRDASNQKIAFVQLSAALFYLSTQMCSFSPQESVVFLFECNHPKERGVTAPSLCLLPPAPNEPDIILTSCEGVLLSMRLPALMRAGCFWAEHACHPRSLACKRSVGLFR